MLTDTFFFRTEATQEGYPGTGATIAVADYVIKPPLGYAYKRWVSTNSENYVYAIRGKYDEGYAGNHRRPYTLVEIAFPDSIIERLKGKYTEKEIKYNLGTSVSFEA